LHAKCISDQKLSIAPDDWFNRFFGSFPFGRRGGRGNYFDDMFRGFDDMSREMERDFEESFKDIETKAPKDLVREYETPEGGKVREIGPFVYGYSMTIGPDGKPRVKEFGNVKSPMGRGRNLYKPMISSEREPLSDVSVTDNEVKVTIEMPGVAKEKIKVNANQDQVEIISEDPQRRYHEIVDIPPEADIETVRSSYNNGILEIVFKKKEQKSPKGKQIRID
jgi:HSP20 family protein